MDLNELEKLALNATPGPWETDGYRFYYVNSDGERSDQWGEFKHDDSFHQSDAEFIVAANPTTVLHLIQQIRQLDDRVRFHEGCDRLYHDGWQQREEEEQDVRSPDI